MTKNYFYSTLNLIPGFLTLLASLIALCYSATALADSKAASTSTAPVVNPWLANSTYSITHQAGSRTERLGPTGPGRALKDNELIWKPVGPINAYPVTYSAPYPDGRSVIWVSGYDRVAKLDADTLEVLSSLSLGVRKFYHPDEVKRHIETMDGLKGQALVDYYTDAIAPAWPSVGAAYKMLTRDNELIFPFLDDDGTSYIRAYGEKDMTDPASDIELRRQWQLPSELAKGKVFGMSLTHDGWLVMVTSDGTVVALSLDFKTHYSLQLPSDGSRGGLAQDVFTAFVRNGIRVDEQGGVYIVTRDNMHRVQWTGERLSLDEADGAWSAKYPNINGKGSGTTPALLGWGPNEDHLVMIADASVRNRSITYWRDEIPGDWEGIPGYDRRVAGVTPFDFGGSSDDPIEMENTPIVFGYDFFFVNTKPEKAMPQETPAKQWMAENLHMNVAGREQLGGTMMRWNPDKRELETVWKTRDNYAGSVCMVSAPTGILYCFGAKDGVWTFQGLDWETGENKFQYPLGTSVKFSPVAGVMVIAPNGAVDCTCLGGFGLVRVHPKNN